MKAPLLFLAMFLKNPAAVSSVVPTSRWAARTIAATVADASRPQMIVELGTGTGAIATALARTGVLHPRSTVLLVELLPALAAYLRATVHDPRFRVVEGDARDLADILRRCGCTAVDAVVSGIPFSTIPRATGDNIIGQVWAHLRPGGTLTAYQVHPVVETRMATRFGNIAKKRLLWNIPPLSVFTAKKPS